MEIALELLEPGGHMLVDDYKYIDTVSDAVDTFIALHLNDEVMSVRHIDSLRGEVLLRKAR
jgi:hypothetical protein